MIVTPRSLPSALLSNPVRTSALLVAFFGIATLAVVSVHAAEAQPYDLGIRIFFPTEHGEEDLRLQLELTLLAELEQAACFRSVRILDPEPEFHEDPEDPATPGDHPDLLVRITISELEETSRFGANIAQRSNPNRTPDVDQMVVVDTEAAFAVEVIATADQIRLRNRRFNETAAYKPRMTEDPRIASWDELIESAARTTRRFLCRGSIAKDLQRASR